MKLSTLLQASYIVVKGEVGLGSLGDPEHAVWASVGVDVKVRH